MRLPMCGGMFVKSVNQAYTVCADGKRAKECYVAEENYDQLGFDPSPLRPMWALIPNYYCAVRLQKVRTPS